MAELVFYVLDGDTTIAVEVDESARGFESAAPRGIPATAASTFRAAMTQAREAADIALQQFTAMQCGPDEIELQFGVKLTAETGAVLAKAATEGTVQVRLLWRATAE